MKSNPLIYNSSTVKNKKGMVFVSAIVFSMLMVTMAVAMSNILLQDVHMIKRLKYSAQAQYIAESGVNVALATLADDFDLSIFPLNGSIGSDSYAITATEEEEGDRVLLTSVGYVPSGAGSAKTVSRTVTAEIEGEVLYSSMDYMMAAGSVLNIRQVGSVTDINGNIHGGLTVWLEATGQINISGTATCSSYSVWIRTHSIGQIEVDGTVYGPNTYEAFAWHKEGGPIDFPEFDYHYYRQLAQDSDDYYPGDVTFEDETLTPKNGIVYVEGKATFRGTNHLYGGIVAKEIYITGGLSSNKFYQHVSGDINVIIGRLNPQSIGVYADFYVENALVYARNAGRFYAWSNATTDVTGVVVSSHHGISLEGYGGEMMFTHQMPKVKFGPDVSSFKAVRLSR